MARTLGHRRRDRHRPMPRLTISEGAAVGLERCRLFLSGRNPAAAKRAAQEIRRHFRLLETNPAIGRPFSGDPDMRELVIGFGDSGYVALYHFDTAADEVIVLAFRHQREAGY